MATVLGYVEYIVQEEEQKAVFTTNTAEMGFDSGNTYYKYAFDLDREQSYMLSIDQSLKSTGISLVSEDFSFKLVMTVIKSSVDDDIDYVNTLLDFLALMLEGLTLRFVCIEQLPPTKYQRVNIKLGPLLGAITSGLNRLPSIRALGKECFFKIYPNTWKSTVYRKDTTIKGKFNNKEEIAKDIIAKFPNLQIYFDLLKHFMGHDFMGHDFDGFDSFGLLFHTRTKCFSEDWAMQNVGVRAQLGTVSCLFKYFDPEDFDVEFAHYFSDKINEGSLVPRDWNEDVAITENFLIAANTNKYVVMHVLSDKLMAAHLIETGEPYDQNKRLFVLVSKETLMKLTEPQQATMTAVGFRCRKYYND